MTAVEQTRHLATAIPGPKSSALIDRKAAAVSRGVGTTMPVYAARAGAASSRTSTAIGSSTSGRASP